MGQDKGLETQYSNTVSVHVISNLDDHSYLQAREGGVWGLGLGRGFSVWGLNERWVHVLAAVLGTQSKDGRGVRAKRI